MTDTASIELQLENTAADTANKLRLSQAEIEYAEQFSKKIDILNIVQILQYGSTAQKRMMDFTDSGLRSLPSRDLDEISEDMKKLIRTLRQFGKDFDSERSKGTDFMTLYDRAEAKVSETQRRLQIHQDSLLRHIRMLERDYDKVLTNIKEFDLYILAGTYCLQNCREHTIPELKKQGSVPAGMELALTVKDYEDAVIRFEKKLEDLKVSRQIPFHTLSQIRVIQNNDALMSENLRRLNANGFPLWKERMILSVGLKGTDESVDSSIFHENNDLLISTLSSLVRIQDDAMEEREKLMAVLNP